MGKRSKIASAEILICCGKDCRRAKGWKATLVTLAAKHRVLTVGCQGVCWGPVVGVVTSSKDTLWFKKVRGKKLHKAVGRTLATGSAPACLKERKA